MQTSPACVPLLLLHPLGHNKTAHWGRYPAQLLLILHYHLAQTHMCQGSGCKSWSHMGTLRVLPMQAATCPPKHTAT